MSDDGRWTAPGTDASRGGPGEGGQPPPQQGWGPPPQGQPQYGQPQYGQPQYGQPQYGQPQYGGVPQQPYGPAGGGWNVPPQAPRPGVVPLRPLGVGEILDGAISAFRAHPKVMIGISAVVAVLTTMVTVVLAVTLFDDTGRSLARTAQPTPDELAEMLADLSLYTGGAFLVSTLATIVLTGLVTVVVSRAVLGQPISTREAWREALPRLGHLLLVALLLLVGLLAIVAAVATPIALVAAVSAPLAVLVGFVLVPVGVGAVVYLWVMFSLSTPVVVLERQGAVGALRRSAGLVRRSFWRTFGILLLTALIVGMVASALQLPFMLVASGGDLLTGGSDPFSFRTQAIQGIGTILGSTITMPLSAAVTVLLYVDLRMRREALDVELQHAAGYAVRGQAATPGVAPDAPGSSW